MARDPARRAASRAADRERKRARREIDRLARQAGQTQSKLVKSSLNARIENLQNQLDASYATRTDGKFSYGKKAQKAFSEISRETSIERKSQTKVDFRAELNKARAGLPSALGEDGLVKSAAFWRATQHYWQGKPYAEREQAIKEGLGVTSLTQAYAKVMRSKEVRAALSGPKWWEPGALEELDSESPEGIAFLEAAAEADAEGLASYNGPREILRISPNAA